ncbi:Choline dehydrogenase, partial [Globisporangium splendens]
MLRHSIRSAALQHKRSFVKSASACRALSSQAPSPQTEEYDYIIVGGGSAGCVLANRLSADPSNKVLLVETGPSDRNKWDSWKIHMPAALTFNLADDKYNWYYYTEPQKNLDNRRLPWPRGRVLGGSSSLNAMVYIRGHAHDYDDWQASGAEGWSYADCLPYFRKAQTHELGPDDYRGGDGPLNVSRGNQKDQILFKKFIEAGIQAGYPYTEDMNGYQQEGFGWMDMTIHKGCRWSAATAYLHPATSRKNLTVITDTFVNKVIFEGKKAVGIDTENNKNKTKTQVRAAKEIILSGGAINSPQLLMLSGVGDAKHLKDVGIPVVQHLPAVGQNMEDHLDLYIQYKCKKPITLHNATWKYPHNMVAIALEWLFNRTGMGASAHLESGGFIRSAPGKQFPDVQYHFLPGSLTGQLTPGPYHAMQAHCSPMRATSRGWLKLRSANPRDHPIIEPNYLDTEEDKIDLRNAVRLTREIFEQKVFDEYRGDAVSPAQDVQSDAEIDAWIRQTTESAYHPSCTNRMGVDENTVVDPQTRVHGLENLRVVDASIMPNIISGNLNAPTIMLAEKAADIILGNPALPKSKASVYQSLNWETSQR